MSDQGRRGFAAAGHPLPLALLVAGGVAGAFIAWPIAGVGAVAYLACAAVLSQAPRPGATPLRSATDRDLTEPSTKSLPIRSTEVMARVVRIRKAHQILHRTLTAATPTIRALLSDSWERLGDFVEHAYALAGTADKLRAHLDATPARGQLEKDRAAAPAGSAQAQSLADQLEARAKLEDEYARLSKQLDEVGVMLEAWPARVLQMNAQAPAEAERATRGVNEELEKMDCVVRALEEAVRA